MSIRFSGMPCDSDDGNPVFRWAEIPKNSRSRGPWDRAMRISFNCDGGSKLYSNYLKTIREITYHIGNLCRRKGFQIEELPQKIGYPDTTVITLINEYIWITETGTVDLPTSEIIAGWAELG